MIRTQIQLTELQARELKKRAALEGRSMADLIRETVTHYLAELSPRPDPSALRQEALDIIGRYRSRKTDLGRNHDRYLFRDSGP